MLRVYKYPVPCKDNFSLMLPKDAKILTVQNQREEPQLWALVDPDAPLEERKFRLAGTGHPVTQENLDYIGTFQLRGGDYIGHLFEIVES